MSGALLRYLGIMLRYMDCCHNVLTNFDVAQNRLFKPIPEHLTNDERIYISYLRTHAIAKVYDMKISDVLELAPKFWQFHQGLIFSVDFAALCVMSTQYNVAGGTFAALISDRLEYRPLLYRILMFDALNQFLLTEVGHGLDARHLETSRDLASKRFTAPKWLRKEFPRVALVFADFLYPRMTGGRPFVVWLNDGEQMREGVTAKLLPNRTGSKALDHAITTFTHGRLPRSALLGLLQKLDNITTLALVMKRVVFVVRISGQTSIPIISFRTQLPILHALAQITVLEAYAEDSIQKFGEFNSAPAVQGGIAATSKAVLCQASQPMFHALSERCGAQGLGTELPSNRYELPPPTNPACLLARHEKGLFDECQSKLKHLEGGHRSAEFISLILPRCLAPVEAIGHRNAYKAAANASIDLDLLALFEICTVLRDASWYICHTDLTREYLFQRVTQLLDTLTASEPYCTAPILSECVGSLC
ncbi:hypothetical protein BDV29DRAFT_188096 [Aspergillus leporis]|uniref:Acyl-CoA oxidase C-terminal domain-containing protein n=1 Tax=Aspergillus leporis TaxID=41062 RepID=A0A5N5XBT2_9EURO|nr:hypothetical protein BDV29DRAFT_188096 [Aspergillus leporis]